MRIELGTLDLDPSQADGQGDLHRVAGLEGWWGSPPATQDLKEPPGNWGTQVSGTRLRGRPLTLECASLAGPGRSGTQVEEKLRAMYAELAAGAVVMKVHENSITRRADVWRVGSPMRGRVFHNRFEWQLDLLAPDPRKYEDDEVVHTINLPGGTTQASSPLIPGGSYPTIPHLIEITGSHGSDVTVVNQDLGKGHYIKTGSTNIKLYPHTGEVTPNRGIRQAASEWYPLSPLGDTIRVTRNYSGASALTVKHYYRKAHL